MECAALDVAACLMQRYSFDDLSLGIANYIYADLEKESGDRFGFYQHTLGCGADWSEETKDAIVRASNDRERFLKFLGSHVSTALKSIRCEMQIQKRARSARSRLRGRPQPRRAGHDRSPRRVTTGGIVSPGRPHDQTTTSPRATDGNVFFFLPAEEKPKAKAASSAKTKAALSPKSKAAVASTKSPANAAAKKAAPAKSAPKAKGAARAAKEKEAKAVSPASIAASSPIVEAPSPVAAPAAASPAVPGAGALSPAFEVAFPPRIRFASSAVESGASVLTAGPPPEQNLQRAEGSAAIPSTVENSVPGKAAFWLLENAMARVKMKGAPALSSSSRPTRKERRLGLEQEATEVSTRKDSKENATPTARKKAAEPKRGTLLGAAPLLDDPLLVLNPPERTATQQDGAGAKELNANESREFTTGRESDSRAFATGLEVPRLTIASGEAAWDKKSWVRQQFLRSSLFERDREQEDLQKLRASQGGIYLVENLPVPSAALDANRASEVAPGTAADSGNEGAANSHSGGSSLEVQQDMSTEEERVDVRRLAEIIVPEVVAPKMNRFSLGSMRAEHEVPEHLKLGKIAQHLGVQEYGRGALDMEREELMLHMRELRDRGAHAHHEGKKNADTFSRKMRALAQQIKTDEQFLAGGVSEGGAELDVPRLDQLLLHARQSHLAAGGRNAANSSGAGGSSSREDRGEAEPKLLNAGEGQGRSLSPLKLPPELQGNKGLFGKPLPDLEVKKKTYVDYVERSASASGQRPSILEKQALPGISLPEQKFVFRAANGGLQPPGALSLNSALFLEPRGLKANFFGKGQVAESGDTRQGHEAVESQHDMHTTSSHADPGQMLHKHEQEPRSTEQEPFYRPTAQTSVAHVADDSSSADHMIHDDDEHAVAAAAVNKNMEKRSMLFFPEPASYSPGKGSFAASLVRDLLGQEIPDENDVADELLEFAEAQWGSRAGSKQVSAVARKSQKYEQEKERVNETTRRTPRGDRGSYHHYNNERLRPPEVLSQHREQEEELDEQDHDTRHLFRRREGAREPERRRREEPSAKESSPTRTKSQKKLLGRDACLEMMRLMGHTPPGEAACRDMLRLLGHEESPVGKTEERGFRDDGDPQLRGFPLVVNENEHFLANGGGHEDDEDLEQEENEGGFAFDGEDELLYARSEYDEATAWLNSRCERAGVAPSTRQELCSQHSQSVAAPRDEQERASASSSSSASAHQRASSSRAGRRPTFSKNTGRQIFASILDGPSSRWFGSRPACSPEEAENSNESVRTASPEDARAVLDFQEPPNIRARPLYYYSEPLSDAEMHRQANDESSPEDAPPSPAADEMEANLLEEVPDERALLGSGRRPVAGHQAVRSSRVGGRAVAQGGASTSQSASRSRCLTAMFYGDSRVQAGSSSGGSQESSSSEYGLSVGSSLVFTSEGEANQAHHAHHHHAHHHHHHHHHSHAEGKAPAGEHEQQHRQLRAEGEAAEERQHPEDAETEAVPQQNQKQPTSRAVAWGEAHPKIFSSAPANPPEINQRKSRPVEFVNALAPKPNASTTSDRGGDTTLAPAASSSSAGDPNITSIMTALDKLKCKLLDVPHMPLPEKLPKRFEDAVETSPLVKPPIIAGVEIPVGPGEAKNEKKGRNFFSDLHHSNVRMAQLRLLEEEQRRAREANDRAAARQAAQERDRELHKDDEEYLARLRKEAHRTSGTSLSRFYEKWNLREADRGKMRALQQGPDHARGVERAHHQDHDRHAHHQDHDRHPHHAGHVSHHPHHSHLAQQDDDGSSSHSFAITFSDSKTFSGISSGRSVGAGEEDDPHPVSGASSKHTAAAEDAACFAATVRQARAKLTEGLMPVPSVHLSPMKRLTEMIAEDERNVRRGERQHREGRNGAAGGERGFREASAATIGVSRAIRAFQMDLRNGTQEPQTDSPGAPGDSNYGHADLVDVGPDTFSVLGTTSNLNASSELADASLSKATTLKTSATKQSQIEPPQGLSPGHVAMGGVFSEHNTLYRHTIKSAMTKFGEPARAFVRKAAHSARLFGARVDDGVGISPTTHGFHESYQAKLQSLLGGNGTTGASKESAARAKGATSSKTPSRKADHVFRERHGHKRSPFREAIEQKMRDEPRYVDEDPLSYGGAFSASRKGDAGDLETLMFVPTLDVKKVGSQQVPQLALGGASASSRAGGAGLYYPPPKQTESAEADSASPGSGQNFETVPTKGARGKARDRSADSSPSPTTSAPGDQLAEPPAYQFAPWVQKLIDDRRPPSPRAMAKLPDDAVVVPGKVVEIEAKVAAQQAPASAAKAYQSVPAVANQEAVAPEKKVVAKKKAPAPSKKLAGDSTEPKAKAVKSASGSAKASSAPSTAEAAKATPSGTGAATTTAAKAPKKKAKVKAKGASKVKKAEGSSMEEGIEEGEHNALPPSSLHSAPSSSSEAVVEAGLGFGMTNNVPVVYDLSSGAVVSCGSVMRVLGLGEGVEIVEDGSSSSAQEATD